jgi:hypothetical protein
MSEYDWDADPDKRYSHTEREFDEREAMRAMLALERIPWARMSRIEIEAVVQDAAVHGDTVLVRRALAALSRRGGT